MSTTVVHRAACALVALAAAACGPSPATPDARARADAAVDPYLPIAPFPAVPTPPDNPTTEARAELGRQLFHDPVLSSDRRVACVTCHGEIWGMSDGLQFSVGIGGEGAPGPGRYGPTHTHRNASTLWNVAWRAGLFWDGRASSLEAQVAFPLENMHELARAPDEVVTELRTFAMYQSLFSAAFPGESQPITAANMARALAAFERTLVSDRAPFDQYAAGNPDAIDAQQVRGWQLFNARGCAACHAPPLFESERYETSPAPEVPGEPDTGRQEFTLRDEDRGRFRVPTLRNLRVTGPYFHNGAVATLEEAVTREANGRAHEGGEISPLEVSDLVAFLRKSLMDITRVPDRPRVAPSGLMVPRDTLEIPRWTDTDGGFL